MIRKSINSDVSNIQRLCTGKNYETDYIRDIISDRVIDDAGRILAYGAVKLFAEAVLVLDDTARFREKVEALRALMEAAIFETKKAKISELHVFTQDEKFADVLRNHFSFVDIKGTCLVRELNG
jgi:hypothetical protein